MTFMRRVDDWAELAAGIAQMQLAGVPAVPLYRALGRGEIALLPMVQPGNSAKFKKWAAAIRMPGVVLLGDDTEVPPDGPNAWPVARRVLGWARFVLIHGGRGEEGQVIRPVPGSVHPAPRTMADLH